MQSRMLAAATVWISGCALPSTVDVTSDPTGAKVTAVEVNALSGTHANVVGTTPCKLKLGRAGLTYGHVLLCEKDGYLAGGMSIHNDGRIFAKPELTTHIELLPDHSLDLKGASFPREVGDRVLEVAALYDEMLATPRFMAAVPAAKARNKLELLIRDFPELKGSATEKTILVLVVKVTRLLAIDGRFQIDKPLRILLARQVEYLLAAVKKAVADGTAPLAVDTKISPTN